MRCRIGRGYSGHGWVGGCKGGCYDSTLDVPGRVSTVVCRWRVDALFLLTPVAVPNTHHLKQARSGLPCFVRNGPCLCTVTTELSSPLNMTLSLPNAVLSCQTFFVDNSFCKLTPYVKMCVALPLVDSERNVMETTIDKLKQIIEETTIFRSVHASRVLCGQGFTSFVPNRGMRLW